MKKRVVIVGAGMAGLTVAWRLLPWIEAGQLQVDIFDPRAQVGGVIATAIVDGAVLEGGPDALLRRKPEAVKLCTELGLHEELIGMRPEVTGAYIYHEGALHAIPAGVQVGVPTNLAALFESTLLSWKGKARAAIEPRLPSYPRQGDDVSLGRFLRYRFGSEVVDRIAAPMLSGIYAGDANHLSLEATFPQLRAWEARAGSIVRALRGSPPPRLGGSPFVTLAKGLGQLPASLQARLGVRVGWHLGEAVGKVEHRPGGGFAVYSDGGLRVADVVVLATPAYVSGRLLQSLAPESSDRLRAIAYTNLAVVGGLWAPSAITRRLDKTGFLVPAGEGVALTACTWVQSKWNYPTPSPWVPLRVFLGRAGEDILAYTDAELWALARDGLAQTMALNAPPHALRIVRHRQAMPQYGVGHRRHIDALLATLPQECPGLWVTGAAYRGVGVPDVIAHAELTAQAVAAATI